ncbi:hypothetical protein PGQ11_007947 [Apiospora arundinis]|uniref:Uncharacterized protein n=1 Tax=Apiospora arundinis TaxID=335852 RepID=A0ABR2IWZ4_9PEZI
MFGDNLIAGSQCDWQPHVYHDDFGPPFIGPSYNYHHHEAESGNPGTLTPGELAIPYQFALSQEFAGGYSYSEHQDFIWDPAAQSTRHSQLENPLVQPQIEASLENLATTDDGLQPETPTSPQVPRVQITKPYSTKSHQTNDFS